MNRKKWFAALLLVWMTATTVNARPPQDSLRLETIGRRLDSLLLADPAYGTEIDLSAGRLPLGELLRNVAKTNGVNLCVKTAEHPLVTCHFNRVRVVDLLAYLCREYRLEIEVVGNIVSVSDPLPLPSPPPVIKVGYDSLKRELSYDLQGEGLVEAVREIARLTGEKIVIPQNLYGRQVSGFINGLPVSEAIEALAVSNGLTAERRDGKYWHLLAGEAGAQDKTVSFQPRHFFTADQVRVDSTGKATVSIQRGSIQDIVTEVCRQANLDRMFLAPLNRQVSLYVRDVDIPSLFHVLFAGTPFLFREENGVYLFGAQEQQKILRTTAVIPLRYRTVENVPELIPEALKADMQIGAFAEQNSLIVSGTSRQIASLRQFVGAIDRTVPLITIEVLIVDSKKSSLREAGITAGVGEKPVKTAGRLSPGVDFTLSAASVNRLIHSFNGFGSVNLGKVTPNFYLTLKALEEAGTLELRSTPKLSTLNGHEASLKSGETRYYKEVQNNIMGTQNPIQSESYTWKSTEADLSLKIVPYVSSDGKITLTIEIEQSEFTAREEKDAPPGTATRSFKSRIRVDNEDMVLLGGIDRNTREKGSSGLPLIARIPVLKWLFGVSTDNKVDEKLSIFIKPTVIF